MIVDATMILRTLLLNRSNTEKIAEACGVPNPVVVAWAKGKDYPDPVSRAVLQLDYQIPAAGWRRKTKRVRRLFCKK